MGVGHEGYRGMPVDSGSFQARLFLDSSLCPAAATAAAGQYFLNARSAVNFYPEWSSFKELYQRASQSSKALTDAFAGVKAFTYLLPNNDALKPAMQVCKGCREGGACINMCFVVVGASADIGNMR